MGHKGLGSYGPDCGDSGEGGAVEAGEENVGHLPEAVIALLACARRIQLAQVVPCRLAPQFLSLIRTLYSPFRRIGTSERQIAFEYTT